jgi:curved DNA-binding protein CbpA
MANEQMKPRLAGEWNPAVSALSPSEGFLLSRIDGETPWAQLRQIGGIPPDEVDRCLERWLSEGMLTLNGSGAASGDGFETGIGLTRKEQRRILEFEASLDRSYHALLGVDRNADSKAIKRAYFALSKEFHPDRHFRLELGGFAKRLERIFMKIVEAYELLSDPATRAEIERGMIETPPAPEAPVAPTAAAREASRTPNEADRPAAKPASSATGRRATLERLRSHFRIPEKVLVERRFKAKQFYQSALVGSKKGEWLEAGACIRLAIAFDPWNDEYKIAFAQVQAEVHQLRASELLRDADASLDARAQHEAMRMYEEALGYRPCDPEINEKAAQLALELDDVDAAREYAETACEMSPQSVSAQRTLGKVLLRQGVCDKAGEVLKRALELDPDDEQTKSAIEALNRKQSARRQREGAR